MKKSNYYLITFVAITMVIVFGITASSTAAAPAQVAAADLTEAEIDGLLFMREEEKLAHDVYTFLYEKWGLNLFNNIAASEQSHTDAVLSILSANGIDDPAAGLAVGEFANADLQALYNDLVAQGSQSLEAALKVGAAIEEIDILDLMEELELTDNPTITLVYENLLKGSYNHLSAFTSTLNRQTGESYEPQYLSVDLYDEIIGSSTSAGSGFGQQGNGKMGNGNQGGGRRGNR